MGSGLVGKVKRSEGMVRPEGRVLVVLFLSAMVAAGCYTPQGQKPVVLPQGFVTGKVSDEETDLPLAAEITFPLDPSLGGVVSDPETGIYRLTLPVGIHRLHVEKDGYKSFEVPVDVTEGRTILRDISLKRKHVAKGTVTGRVTDARTGLALGAMITFPGTAVPATASDLRNGIYKTTLPPGTYVITVIAQGYLTVSSPVVVLDGASVIQNFELRRN